MELSFVQMIIVIPLGGIGNRFRECKYSRPKPLIYVLGKEIIFHLLDSLNLSQVELVIIPYNYELTSYCFENLLSNRYPTVKFLFQRLSGPTRGAVETIKIALETINSLDDQP